MNKLSTVCIALLVLCLLLPCVSAFSGSGAGTVVSPYLVTTCSQLNETRSNLSGYYQLQNNIDCINYGTWDKIDGNFVGQWNGSGYAIKNLYTSHNSVNYNDYSAIFAEAFYSNTILQFTNIIFDNVTSKSIVNNANYGSVGLLSSSANGWGTAPTGHIFGDRIFFYNCNASMSSGSGYVYGFAGLLWGSSYNGYANMKFENMGIYNSKTYSHGSSDARVGGYEGEHGGAVNMSNSYAYVNANNGGIGTSGVFASGNTQYGTYTGINNFYDVNLSVPGTSTNKAATALTTTQMKNQSSFTNWDFTSANGWVMSLSGSAWNGYPVFNNSPYFQTGIYALPLPPVASFTKDKTSGDAPLTVKFTDSSTNTPTSWSWVFGDGSSTNATVQSPVHTFDTEGTYNVNLTATNSDGSNTTATQSITVNAVAPVASFTKSGTGGTSPYTVIFTDTSTNIPTSWLWVFGDGSSTNATVKNPVHTFTGGAVYNVNLTAINSAGESTTATQAITVVGVPTAAFTSTNSVAQVYPLKTTFIDNSTGTPTSWAWTFGDGRTSTLQNPTYQYTVAGNYTVKMTATNAYGSTNITHYVDLLTDDDVYLKSWLHFNTTPLQDLKGNQWTLNGASVSAAQSKFGGTSLYVSTNNNYASSVSSTGWDLGTGDFDVSFWIRPVTLSGAQNLISRTTGIGSGTGTGWGFRNNGSTSGYSFWTGTTATETTPFAMTSDEWHHIVITRVSGVIEVFKDGALMSTNTRSGNYDTTNPLVIGVSEPGTDDDFYIDEFRISLGYPRFTSAFDTPFAEYRGNLVANYVNIQPDATLRYKTDPGTPGVPTISNLTPRYRTVQIQNVVNATNITTAVYYTLSIIKCLGVQLNTTDYNDMSLSGVNIDEVHGIISFTVSRNLGIKGTGAQRINLADITMLYYNYAPQAYVDTYFDGGSTITDGQHNVTYPIINFIDTPVYLSWTTMSGFTANNTVPRMNTDTVMFNSELNHTANRFHWDFGDGNTLLTTNGIATHAYASTGLKTVSLEAYLFENASVTNTTTKTNYINVVSPPDASFSADTNYGASPLTVVFTDTSTYSPTSWLWVFGDGDTTNSTVQNPIHTFTGSGTYYTNLTAINAYGSDTTGTLGITVYDVLTPSFTKTSSLGMSPLLVDFAAVNGAGSKADTYKWVASDGQTSTLSAPALTFTKGVWSINLTTTNTTYSITNTTATQSITVYDPLTPSFTAIVPTGSAPLDVSFTGYPGTGSKPDTWRYVASNGWNSTLQSVHGIFDPGVYTVNLTVQNLTYGISATTATQTITSNFQANFTATPRIGVEPLNVQFTDTSTGEPTGWTWIFGCNAVPSTSNLQNPTATLWAGVNSNATCGARLWINKSGVVDTYYDAPSNYFTVIYDQPRNVSWVTNITSNTGAVPPDLAVKFTAVWQNGTPTTYDWYFNGIHSSAIEEDVIFGLNGTYWVNLTVSNPHGSTTYNGTYIVRGKAPYITGMSVGYGSGVLYPPTPSVPFGVSYDLSYGGIPTSYLWDFNDGTTSTLQNPTHVFTAPGIFNVSVMETNMWGYDKHYTLFEVKTPLPQSVASLKWQDANGAVITSGYTGNTVSFAFDTVGKGTNPPMGYLADYFLLYFYKKDVNTGNWLMETPTFTCQEMAYGNTVFHTSLNTLPIATIGGTVRSLGYCNVSFVDPQTYRAEIKTHNATNSITYPPVSLGTVDIVITNNPLLVSNVGGWASDVGGMGLKLLLAAIIMLILVGLPYLITRQFNLYLEVVMAVISIGLSYALQLIDPWVIFGLILLAVASVFFMGRGGGGGNSQGEGDIG